MKKTILLLIGSVLLLTSACIFQKTLTPAQAKDHVDKKVKIAGTVDQVKTTDKLTYLNMGGKYPNNTFTAVIFTKDKATFPEADSTLIGKKVVISGTVKMFNEKAEIILKKKEQLKIK